MHKVCQLNKDPSILPIIIACYVVKNLEKEFLRIQLVKEAS